MFFFSFINKYKKTNNKNKNLFHFTFLKNLYRPCLYALSLIILASCGGGGGGGSGGVPKSPQSQQAPQVPPYPQMRRTPRVLQIILTDVKIEPFRAHDQLCTHYRPMKTIPNILLRLA